MPENESNWMYIHLGSFNVDGFLFPVRENSEPISASMYFFHTILVF